MFRQGLFEGAHILVTGGGTGLGKAMAQRYAELGAELTLWGRRGGVLSDTAAEISSAIGATVNTDSVDIRDPHAIAAAMERIWAGRPLTGLVNNAAGNFISRTEDLSPRGFNAIASIVFHGSFYVTLEAGKRWIESGSKGSVISILTTWVWTGSAFTVPSAMSKAGLRAMTESLAVEWGPKGIRLNAIAPGPFPTKGAWDRLNPGSDGSENGVVKTNPMRRVGTHSELGNLAAFLMSDEVGYINGHTVAIDGGQWLNNAGTFSQLWDVTDAQWQQMRDMIRSANEKDKATRG